MLADNLNESSMAQAILELFEQYNDISSAYEDLSIKYDEICSQTKNEMEADEADDYYSEHEHVLGRPGIGCRLACDLISLYSSAGDDVLDCEPASIEDMYDESEREYRHHDGDDRECHEIASCLEKSVSSTELAGKAVDDGEGIDGNVQTQEKNQECSTDRLDEFLSD